MVPINRRRKIESLLLDLGFAEKDIDLLTIAVLYHLEGMGMLKIYQKISIERGGKSGRIEKLIHEAILRAWLQQTPMMRDMFFWISYPAVPQKPNHHQNHQQRNRKNRAKKNAEISGN